MKINFVRLENFRNAAFCDVPLDARDAWVFGRNAQGKTNLLEAMGMLPALRSFRTNQTRALVKSGEKSARILAGVSHDTLGECEVEIDIAGSSRTAFIDGKETKLTDFIGIFPAFALTSEDVKFLRGAPEIRRREIDMFISEIDPDYFSALRKYHAALAQRNALLRENADNSPWDSFEQIMAEAAETVSRKRAETLETLGKIATEKYALLAAGAIDRAEIRLKPSEENCSIENFRKILAENRASDIERGYTSKGPHRDDFAVSISELDARNYSSEGQQRSAVLALKLAEFEVFLKIKKIEPVILCDDILGELDPMRREAFWSCVPKHAQIVASSTLPPPEAKDGVNSRCWREIRVECGSYK